MNQKKRDLDNWEKDECAALKAAINAYNKARPKKDRITQEQAGAALGMNQGSFSNYLNGRLALNLEFAIKVSKLFGIPIEKFSNRLANEINTINREEPKNHLLSEAHLDNSYADARTNQSGVHHIERDSDVQIFDLSRTTVSAASPSASAPAPADTQKIRLKHRFNELVMRIEEMMHYEQIEDSDFDLLNSMLDRFASHASDIKKNKSERRERY